jgi:hypothetical protein
MTRETQHCVTAGAMRVAVAVPLVQLRSGH